MKQGRTWTRSVYWAAVGVLLALLALALSGPMLASEVPRRAGSAPPDRDAIPGYDAPLRSPQAVLLALDEGPPDPGAAALVRLTYESMAHDDPVQIALTDNWLLWSLGQVHSDLLVTQNPRRLAAGARGICSDAAIVLIALAQRSGMQARMISLDGHVLCELKTAAGWKIADPDYGILFPFDLETLASPRGIERIREEVRDRGHPPETADLYVAVASSAEDNEVVEAGVLNPRLAWVERVADELQWALPLAGLCLLVLLPLLGRSRTMPA